MKVDTLYFGEMEIKEESLIHFEAGLPGFQDEKKFIVLKLPDNKAFQILQSIQTRELAFVLTVPYFTYQDYEFDLDNGTISQLDIEKPEDVSVYSIVTLQDTLKNSTLNLQAPVVINVRNNKGKQIVLNDQRYKTKHPLQPESEGVAHASSYTKSR
ncbi:flagellar assembly factor FliW [Salinibacillus kushneri]|uniref:Flagellar assembly factor FliW n=1 Tax=Salinibacillus kushneri TaxID=237682 RepID=A0A1H9YSV8_9BACI|nr:flagellar assembly protein FliW [Salinibacillus kushneri]SES71743.1 flagellar assembly factor FliW [Salinibacillus kushneri]